MKDGDNGYIGILDTSGSMTSLVPGTKVSSYSVGKGLTLFMSYLLKGRFNSCYLEFSDSTIMKQWRGNTPVEQLCNDNSSIVAGTNFLSVAGHFGKILKEGVPESEFPKVLYALVMDVLIVQVVINLISDHCLKDCHLLDLVKSM